MPHIATLIAVELDAVSLTRARAVLPRTEAPVWLGPGSAADIPFEADAQGDIRQIVEAVRSVLAPAPIDVVVQPAADRRKRLLLADMDSTIIGQECIDELADFVGKKAFVSAITERAMRGEIAFEPALRERVALLKGLPVSVVDEVIRQRITLTPGARTLIATMRAHGAHTCLVSGGFTLFTTKIAAMAGFDEQHGNTLVVEDGHFTGDVADPILGRDGKLETLRDLRRRLGLAKEETLVVGDGANDLDMVTDAGLGVAYHAKPKVAEAAAARIDHADLSALLYAQGYRRDEFVEA
jgi:phosphoserine phosphatase